MDGAQDDRPVPTRRALLELEFPGASDFDDPALERRRLFSEFLGTFLLVLAGAGAALLGAVVACLFLWAALGKQGALGATEPGGGAHAWQALLIEFVLTIGLVSTILGTASRAQNIGALSAIGVGGYIVLAGLWAGPISGASMNPARSFGPDLVRLDFANYWLYLAGPLAGAAVATAVAWVLRGRGDAVVAAQGLLGLKAAERLRSRGER